MGRLSTTECTYLPTYLPRLVAGNAGVCGRSTRGAWRAAALAAAAPAAAAVSPPRVQRPPRGGVRGCCLSGRPPSALGLGGRGEGGVPWSPHAAPQRPRGRQPGGSGPGGPAADRGDALFPCPPLPFESGTLVQALTGVPCSPHRRRAAPAGGGGGGGPVGAGPAARVSGQLLVGCGAVGPPSHWLPPPPLPREVARAPPSRCTVGGAWVGGPGSVRGGRPAALSPSHSPAPAVWDDGAWPSPASPLAWGLGLWRWRVPPAVAPVGEGVAQGPGEPVVGVCIRDAEHSPPLQEGRPRRLSVGPRRPNHRPEDPLVVLRGRRPPRGYLPGLTVPREEHGIEGTAPHPPGGPRAGRAQPTVHLHHPGDGLIPQGVQDRAPRAGSPSSPCACGAGAAPRPPAAEAAAIRAAPPSARGGLAGAGVVGVGGG